ncbi:MAG: hypothetical protein JNM43_08500 [Planctomycetaceae bacterium]|nr:hypothetical protein [Planctomycetaceae bacterium]
MVLRRLNFPTLPLLAAVLYAWPWCGVKADEQPADKLPAGLCAMELSDDGKTVFVGGSRSSYLSLIDLEKWAIRQVRMPDKGIASLKTLRDSNSVLLAIQDPPSLLDMQLEPAPEPLIRLPLPGTPRCLAISDIGVVCVTMTWEHAVALASIDEAGRLSPIEPRIVPLSFPPGRVIAVANNRFLIADAFGGKLALVDLSSKSPVQERELPIHHIGGLTVAESGTVIHLTHQRLSSIAETSHDDLHWGTLMQNSVSSFSLSSFPDRTVSDTRLLKTRRLGLVGNGAADPAGVIAFENGDLCAAIGGTDQVAVLRKGAEQPEFVDVGVLPTEVIRLDETRVAVLNRLSETLSVVRTIRPAELISTIGPPRLLESPEARGERAFYSARLSHDQWMSCNSCHIDGHSPDLLADTLGDGRHESPKRIPSLFDVAHTGPWSWIGNKSTLEDQVRQTLQTTMHGDEQRVETLGDVATTTSDLNAYMATLVQPLRSQLSHATVEQGRMLFESRGCVKCHAPENYWTTKSSWDIGVRDEQGHSEFNPPSLKSVTHRRAFFHDARFETLQELLQDHHPGQTQPSSPDEIQLLQDYLKSI